MQSTAVRGLLLLLLAFNLLLNATFVVLFVLNPVDYCLTSREVCPCSRLEAGALAGLESLHYVPKPSTLTLSLT